MKIAVISDIHSNIAALEAVLIDLEQQGNADHIVVTGDMFAFGAAPNEVLAVLRQLPHAHLLRGNAERYLLEGTYPSSPNGDGWKNDLLLTFRWTAEQLGHDGLSFLGTLPSYQVIQVGARQLLAVHGSTRSDEEGLSVRTEVNEFERMLIDPQVAIVACGHTHVPMDRTLGCVRVVNAGSVGIPFDGDPRACYAIIRNPEGNGSGPTRVELRRVAYDVDKAIEQFYARNCPAADISAYNLRTGRSVGSSLIYTPEMRHNSQPAAVGHR
jgi:putative phosphoesterase